MGIKCNCANGSHWAGVPYFVKWLRIHLKFRWPPPRVSYVTGSIRLYVTPASASLQQQVFLFLFGATHCRWSQHLSHPLSSRICFHHSFSSLCLEFLLSSGFLLCLLMFFHTKNKRSSSKHHVLHFLPLFHLLFQWVNLKNSLSDRSHPSSWDRTSRIFLRLQAKQTAFILPMLVVNGEDFGPQLSPLAGGKDSEMIKGRVHVLFIIPCI